MNKAMVNRELGYHTIMLKRLEREGYEGPDMCLETSLYGYGLIWRKEKREYRFWYGFQIGGGSLKYTAFDWGCIDIDDMDFDPNNSESWVNWEDVAKTIELSLDKLAGLPFPLRIYALVGYYGPENIFGTASNTLTKIENNL